MQKLLSILWPSFLVAGIAEGLFFTLIDPQELYLLGEPVRLSRMATYSLGFLCFWAICAASSLVTWYLLRSAAEVNRRVGAVH
ncbi:MAG: hypothetical protein CVU17_01790 [Betaproteobacteria bacterium HGW-Betaproteobacteria-11]|nr:MAG: hypothetical protein CVU17_01790 [Betaproteobacteria bacterium HGW-Betaproteobacteria-11]